MSAGFTLDLSKFKTKVGVRTDAVLRRVAMKHSPASFARRQ